jgi:hypothetical protein
MKTTIDLPESVFRRAKVAAAQQGVTLKELMITGLELALQNGRDSGSRDAALVRLRKGLSLGAKPLTREQTHERKAVS